jgi:hypothetical protein
MHDGCDDIRERDRMATWIDTQWAIIGASPAVLRVMACGPSAVAGLMTKMLFEMGADIAQVKEAAKAILEIEIPDDKLYLVDEFKARAIHHGPVQFTPASMADAIADTISDITQIRADVAALTRRIDDFEREIKEAGTKAVVHGA